jgi:Xaa-Pro aminopeptidase
MRAPLENQKIFAERRLKLASQIKGSALIVAAPAESIRNSDVHNSYRQDSSLYYLTGFEEPGSILVFRPGMTPETVMFVRKKDLERETWDGFRYGPEQVEVQFRIEKAYPVEEFSKQIVDLLKPVDQLYYRFFKDEAADALVKNALLTTKAAQGRTGYGILPVYDADEMLGELRIFKSDAEIETLRKACAISAEAHLEVMRYTRPGMNERELAGYFIYQIMKRGAAREGYGGIFAGGANACTLHYVYNDQALNAKDLILVDAGAEYNYFTGDITRCFPVSGKFTEEQAEVYEGVLKVQKELIESVKPGVPFQQFHELGASMLTDLMLELGLLSGRKEDIMQANQHKKYYPHGIGHFLGMDVHDVGLYFNKPNREPRKIEAGMVFTIEPGIYIPEKGIGIRIEDNILVTHHGHENLTAKCVKEISEIEKIVGNL